MFRIILTFLSILCYISGFTQPVPTSYKEAKKLGDAKYKMLLEVNTPEEVHYVVLKSGADLDRQLKYENSVYVISKVFDLKGKTISIPKNSVLVFRDGNVKNGTLLGENAKYAMVGNKAIGCQLKGQFERIASVYTASELGMRPGSNKSAEYNSAKLQEIIKMGVNIYLDGAYYFSFSKPILLNYQLHLFGGEFIFSKYAFDLTNGGGIYANGVHFSSMRKGIVDDIVCGTRDKHPAITTTPLSFLNCRFSCNRIVSLSFTDINPKETPYGIPYVNVSNCLADRTGKFIILNAVIKDGCSFKNNTWTGFTSAPIYLTCSHSKRTHPDEADANPWAEEIVDACGDVVVDSNIFVGKEVTDNSYYCAALVDSKRCFFTNNYLKDLINISDNKGAGYTAYDAYLSCVEVIYKNNYVEDMMSYSKDGAKKPQCEIGKSKSNPLEYFGVEARREYTDNVFVSDGKRFLDEGADPESVYVNIFNNTSPIDEYVWERNAVIYRNIIIKGRTSSSKYRSFSLKDNYFECAQITGNLIFSNSANNCSKIEIRDNSFKMDQTSSIVVFNQLYQKEYKNYKQGSITITGNEYDNSAPLYHFFVADTVRIKENTVRNATLAKNTYLNNYSGQDTPLAVRSMDAELVLDTKGQSKGGVHQVFTSSSSGSYFLDLKDIPEKGVYYSYQIGSDHSFDILLYQGGQVVYDIGFSVKNGKVSCRNNGQQETIVFGKTKPIVRSVGKGLKMKISFGKGTPNSITTSIIGHSEKDVRVGFIGK